MFDQKKYASEFNKNNYKQFTLRINKNETDVLEQLAKQKSVNGYITDLIRDDIKSKKIIENLKNLVSEEDWKKATSGL